LLPLVPKPSYEIEFYQDEFGDQPVKRWLKEELTPRQRRAIGYAMSEVLEHLGVGVCGTEFGKQLGGGLFEFRLRRNLRAIAAQPRGQQAQERTRAGAPEKVLLRVFCHAHSEKLILLLAGYDKARDPSSKRQETEIQLARKRLEDWRRRRTSRRQKDT
jgi:hypothetical protein